MIVGDATTRFSKRVGTYVRFRPGYPPGVVDLLARESGLSGESLVADVGSGTGLLSRAFLDAGCRVIGVEPNAEMRSAGDALLAEYAGRFHSVNGTAEATTLEDHSVELATAGQAFHWFDVPAARREWARILKPGGVAALIWNERLVQGSFMRAVESVVDRYAGEMDRDGLIREAGRSRIPGFFAPSQFREDEFPNSQRFEFDGLVGRVASSSFLPGEGDPHYEEMVSDLRRVFERHEQDGMVEFEYRTKVFRGRL